MKDQPKNLPKQPGVYLFKNNKGEVLYVGRAVSLKQRVANYFQKGLDPRISEMVEKASQLKHYETETLLEAVILEANLIKKHWPKYNIREKDHRSFVYIVIPKTDYPKPFISRQRELQKFPAKADVFGPYQSYSIAKKALRIIRRVFPYSDYKCKPFSGKPCFDYQIGLCPGLCVGALTKEDYHQNIKNIILLLSGKKKRLLKKLEKENPDQIKALRHIQDVSLVSKENNLAAGLYRIEGYDISHLSGKESFGAMVVFTDNRPDKNEYRLFKIRKAPKSDDLRALEEVLERRLNHTEWTLPDLILVDGGKPQVDYLSDLFKRLNVKIPLVGLSKYKDKDKLVFQKLTKKSAKDLIRSMKPVLVKVRDEAHRFSGKASRRKRKKIISTP